MFGRTKEAYEGDTVSLTCSDDNPRGRFSRVKSQSAILKENYILTRLLTTMKHFSSAVRMGA